MYDSNCGASYHILHTIDRLDIMATIISPSLILLLWALGARIRPPKAFQNKIALRIS
jgi:hypothetical protein